MTRCWDVDPNATIDAIGEWCLSRRGVDRLLVTARADLSHPHLLDEPRIDDSVTAIFGEAVLEIRWASAWPGTQLMKGASKVYVIRFDEDVRARMVAAQKRLAGWNQWNDPPLPADLIPPPPRFTAAPTRAAGAAARAGGGSRRKGR